MCESLRSAESAGFSMLAVQGNMFHEGALGAIALPHRIRFLKLILPENQMVHEGRVSPGMFEVMQTYWISMYL